MSSDARKVDQEVARAARSLQKHLKACVALGLHPDEFWHEVIKRADPRECVRPRRVSLAQEGKRRRAAKARRKRQSDNFRRNELIRAHFETSLRVGESRADIYSAMSKRFGLKERQLRTICLGISGEK
jgi:hypothetical protein